MRRGNCRERVFDLRPLHHPPAPDTTVVYRGPAVSRKGGAPPRSRPADPSSSSASSARPRHRMPHSHRNRSADALECLADHEHGSRSTPTLVVGRLAVTVSKLTGHVSRRGGHSAVAARQNVDCIFSATASDGRRTRPEGRQLIPAELD